MRPHNYTTGLVTQQYYYYYHSLPYFESKYIAEHDCMYDPEKTTSRILRLCDGTRIEGFGNCSSKELVIFIFLIVILITIFIYSKKI